MAHAHIAGHVGAIVICPGSTQNVNVATGKWKEEPVVGMIMASKTGGQECLPKP